MSVEDGATVVELADRLWRAAVDRSPIEPITRIRTDLTVQDAYAIQMHNVRRRVAASAVVKGRRLGDVPSPAELLGVDEPDFGVLLDDMFLDEGHDIPLELFVQPCVVATIAFVLATDLAGPGVTIADALTAVAGVMPAVEIVDSRIASWQVEVADTVADNASAGKVVLGGRITRSPPSTCAWSGCCCSATGYRSRARPARPHWATPHAASSGWRTSSPPDRGLRRGDIVLAGPLHRLVSVRRGDFYQAEFAHLGT